MNKTNRASSLHIQNLHASVEGKEILKGVTLTVKPGQIHAIMGPNGSGKSTFAQVLLGHPAYTHRASRITQYARVGRTQILPLTTEERAKAGLFLAFQSPIAIPGVSAMNLLRSAYQILYPSYAGLQPEGLSKRLRWVYAGIRDFSMDTETIPIVFGIHSKKNGKKKDQAVQNPVLARRWQSADLNLEEFGLMIKEHARSLALESSFLTRGIHDGFSGGEKKKLEMLQALVLKPKFAIFDEIDTGLDVDALRVVARGIKRLAKEGAGIIVITHYQRILKYVKPHVVHVFVDGRIVATGTARLAKQIEEKGYGSYAKATDRRGL